MIEKKSGVTITMNDAAERSALFQPGAVQPKAVQPDIEEQQTDTTIILKGTTISGELYGTGSVLIEGTVTGGIRVDGTVTVARSGVVNGPIKAGDVFVAGSVTGDIFARAALRLEMTGNITGNVTMRSFTIEDGGCFDGQSHMTASDAEPVILYHEPDQREQG